MGINSGSNVTNIQNILIVMVHQCIHDSKVSLEVVSRQMPDEQEWMREEQPRVTTRLEMVLGLRKL